MTVIAVALRGPGDPYVLMIIGGIAVAVIAGLAVCLLVSRRNERRRGYRHRH